MGTKPSADIYQPINTIHSNHVLTSLTARAGVVLDEEDKVLHAELVNGNYSRTKLQRSTESTGLKPITYWHHDAVSVGIF